MCIIIAKQVICPTENYIDMMDLNCSDKTRQACESLMQQSHLPPDFVAVIADIYLPLSRILIDQVGNKTLLVSINGAQGTGKSTLTHFLKLIIESELNARVATLSLDDFYHTRRQRQLLAEQVHPLLITRGVPGTHDADLIETVLEKFMSGKPCVVPRFNKATDDRYDESEWSSCDRAVDVVLFEGWCNSSPVQNERQLEQTINELEANEDKQGVWRYYANDQLKSYHQRFYQYADLCLLLKAPDFEHVYQWRHLQEQKLKAGTPEHLQHRVLDDAALRRFLLHYERISRHTLEHLPETADVVLPIASDHSIDSIQVKT